MSEATVIERVEVEHQHHGHKQFYIVWGGLLLLTAIEVVLAYEQLQPVRMLVILMGLSIIKAALIIAYFMHMKFEKTLMRWMMMASVVICLVLMCIFFPDAMRVVSLGVK